MVIRIHPQCALSRLPSLQDHLVLETLPPFRIILHWTTLSPPGRSEMMYFQIPRRIDVGSSVATNAGPPSSSRLFQTRPSDPPGDVAHAFLRAVPPFLATFLVVVRRPFSRPAGCRQEWRHGAQECVRHIAFEPDILKSMANPSRQQATRLIQVDVAGERFLRTF